MEGRLTHSSECVAGVFFTSNQVDFVPGPNQSKLDSVSISDDLSENVLENDEGSLPANFIYSILFLFDSTLMIIFLNLQVFSLPVSKADGRSKLQQHLYTNNLIVRATRLWPSSGSSPLCSKSRCEKLA